MCEQSSCFFKKKRVKFVLGQLRIAIVFLNNNPNFKSSKSWFLSHGLLLINPLHSILENHSKL